MEEIQLIGEKLENSKSILAEHMELFEENSPYTHRENVKDIRENLIQIFADALIDDKEKAMNKMKKMGMEVGQSLVDLLIPLDTIIGEIQLGRRLFWSFIEEEVSNRHYSVEVLLRASSIVDSILDEFMHCVSLSYVNHYKKIADEANESLNEIKKSQEVIAELSTPIVKTVLEGVLLVPLIGRIDECRMESMQTTVLEKCADYNAESIILDFSGITYSNNENMFHLLDQLAGALALMGTETMFVGFTPDVVRKIYNFDFMNEVKSYLSFSQAMAAIMKRRKVALRPI